MVDRSGYVDDEKSDVSSEVDVEREGVDRR